MKLIKKLGIIIMFSVTIAVGSTKVEAAPLYVRSIETPSEVTDTAKSNWEGYLQNILYLDNRNVSEYYLGQPFTVNYSETASYNYPILEKNSKKISYILQVDYNQQQDNPSIMLSKKLAKELESVSNSIRTNADIPITLEGNESNIYYEFQNKIEPLLVVDADLNMEIPNETRNSVTDITELLASPNTRVKRSVMEFDHKVLPWTVYETQGSEPWCYYYSIAAALNNQKGSQLTTASKLIHQRFPTATEQQLLDGKFVTNDSIKSILSFVNKTYNKNIKFENNLLSFEQVKTELTNNASISIGMTAPENIGHSINLIGYTAPKDGDIKNYPVYYYYWNPWWKDTFVVSSNTTHLQLAQCNYKLAHSTYNFR